VETRVIGEKDELVKSELGLQLTELAFAFDTAKQAYPNFSRLSNSEDWKLAKPTKSEGQVFVCGKDEFGFRNSYSLGINAKVTFAETNHLVLELQLMERNLKPYLTGTLVRRFKQRELNKATILLNKLSLVLPLEYDSPMDVYFMYTEIRHYIRQAGTRGKDEIVIRNSNELSLTTYEALAKHFKINIIIGDSNV